MPPPQRSRLDPQVFDLPVEKMRAGWYTDAYFNHARAALLRDGRRPRVVLQAFQKKHSYLGGVDEAIAILKLCVDDWAALTVSALHDGDRIEPYEPVLTIEGDYTSFAHLETVYLGTLARRTLITTNTVRVLEAANGKPLIFMAARHDHHRVQTGDGYAAYIAGEVVGRPIGVTTDEQASWWGGRALGTVPHALIAAYDGDTVLAARALRRLGARGHERDGARRLRERLRAHRARRRARARRRGCGVCASTRPSRSSTARSWDELGDFRPTGVNPQLVRKVRDALDAGGFGGSRSSSRAGSPSTRSVSSRRAVCPSTRTASARR